MTGGFRYDGYPASGGVELIVHAGPVDAERRILFVPPLFEELNRLRRTMMLTMRRLAARGIAGFLIDLPGQNESPLDLGAVTIEGWRESVTLAARNINATHVASIRAGANIDDTPGLPAWRLAPLSGAKQMNLLLRAQVAADKQNGLSRTREDYRAMARGEAVILGGKTFSPAFFSQLSEAEPLAREDIVTGEGDFGPPLWLRTEPGESADMAEKMATALDQWSRQTMP